MPRITGVDDLLTPAQTTKLSARWLWLVALLCMIGGLLWLWAAQSTRLPAGEPEQFHTTYPLDGSTFVYSPGWRVTATEADPSEPPDPWIEPAGRITFTVAGQDLWLRLAVGDYWGYLYATVDGAPANRLALIPGNRNSRGERAGYRTLYAPEAQHTDGPTPQWIPLHRASDGGEHQVVLEFWRGWGQSPLRGVAAEPILPHYPRWPGVALLVLAAWGGAGARRRPTVFSIADRPPQQAPQALKALPLLGGIVGLMIVALGVAWGHWLITLGGMGVLGLAALVWPVLWPAALLFGLPFYYTFSLPLLPWRSFGLIDIGVLGSVGLLAIQWLPIGIKRQKLGKFGSNSPSASVWPLLLIGAIASWALIATFAADHQDVALREWRVVFLAAILFAWSLPHLVSVASSAPTGHRPWWRIPDDPTLLLVAWIGGSVVVAAVALWHYASGAELIAAEGVGRVRAFYGSPNNLALYLERTLAVTLALALLARDWRMQLLTGALAAVQGAALVLTFSKGALLFGLPALLITLWIGGLIVVHRQGRSPRLLWLLAGVGGVALLALVPFLGTERFQRLLDFTQGTGFLRLHLWRSAWQMALDHPLLGVGPDNFLYAYRSIYLLPAAWQEPNLNHPHNWPLDWWTRLGLPGLLLALAWFGWMARQLWRGVCNGSRPVLSLGLLAALVAALVHGLIDASYALPDLMLVWVLMSVLANEAVTESPQSPRPG
jgi:hypothetical protein